MKEQSNLNEKDLQPSNQNSSFKNPTSSTTAHWLHSSLHFALPRPLESRNSTIQTPPFLFLSLHRFRLLEREFSCIRSYRMSMAKQAEQLKLDGNICFNKHRLGAAIDAYTEAITLCPNVPVYWSNRALCHLKRDDWTRAEEDCRRAIQLDQNSFKAHYMLGRALLKREEYAQGINFLERALDLGRGAHPNSYMVEEIWEELSKAKHLEWECESSNRSWELQDLKEACETALKEKNQYDIPETEGFANEITDSSSKQLQALSQVFERAAEDDTPTEIPDYLCCNITLDIFRDPVITPSGVTYERATILEHLEKVGYFDPITREPLYPNRLVPNLAIKEAVRAYLEKHGWAYRMD